ncbi:MAG: universal stress protein [Flavobacteriales bacterium]|nr:universal stress protein [Flavobacteriales bacterium]
MAHILIPTDFSANAFNAAVYAIELYGQKGNTFTLLHAYMSVSDPTIVQAAGLEAEIAREANSALGELTERLKEKFAGAELDLQQSMMTGDVFAAILAHTDEERNPDLVVMGTQGASGLEEVLLGTHTADVIKRCHLPVLTVPEEANYRIPRRIVMADDGGPVDRASIKVLLEIARWSQSEIMIVRVFQGEDASNSDDHDSPYDLVLGAIPRSFHSISGENVSKALHDMADQSDADLVVVMHRQRSMFAQLFHRSTAAKLAMHTHIPMLVLQQNPS